MTFHLEEWHLQMSEGGNSLAVKSMAGQMVVVKGRVEATDSEMDYEVVDLYRREFGRAQW